MPEFLLFVDTETSGIPRDWGAPYAKAGAWPHVVQLAWLIYRPDGQLVKTENHYIRPSDYDISPASGQVHGLTRRFLEAHGDSRHAVMQRLHDDLSTYQPLVVGHFMALDFHMIGVSFHRAGLPNPLLALPTFCTMRLTERFVLPWQQQYLRLADLYHRQFGRAMPQQHDALADAQATAECFFELQKKGDISEATMAAQPKLWPPTGQVMPRGWWRWGGAVLAILLLCFLIWRL